MEGGDKFSFLLFMSFGSILHSILTIAMLYARIQESVLLPSLIFDSVKVAALLQLFFCAEPRLILQNPSFLTS